jgi:hypothetical protein
MMPTFHHDGSIRRDVRGALARNNEPGTEAYDVNIAMSHDGGATWSKPLFLIATR